MARPSCRDALMILGMTLICGGSGCSGKDPYRPGESIGAFHVTAKLVSTTCGKTPDPWAFDVRLRHEKTTLYWVQGDAPISGVVDATARAVLKAKATQTLRAANPKSQMAACAMERADVLDLVLAPIATPVADLQPATSFKGTLTYHFPATDGSDCEDQLAASGGDFDALPCDVHYDLDGVRTALVVLSRKHRDTPMAGRTHLQQALPITFGHKTAIWLSMLDRHAARLTEIRPRVEQAQFGGAAGTLASLGTQGLAVRAAFARELRLGDPDITWHVARDGLTEAVQTLGLITGSLAKIALDVMMMMSTEFSEVAEPFVESRGASSTMPQKRNPISCELILAAARIVRQSSGLMLDALVTDFERATGPWHLEWAAIPEAFLATASALHQARFMLSGLIVDPARMRRNLDMTSGLIVAEAVMMGLAPHMGRNEAHDVVYEACRAALEKGGTLLAHLEADVRVTRHLRGAELAALVEPGNYLGVAGRMIDAVVGGRT